MDDSWAAGSAYERFMGRWSRALAARFVAWTSVGPGAHWLDVGCGTGALAHAIAVGAAPGSVVACDPARPLLEYARGDRSDGSIEFIEAGVGQLPAREGGYDAVASLLALNFFPEPDRAIEEMRALCRSGGAVAACVWDYAQDMQFLRRFWDAAVALDPAARELDEGGRFPLCRPDALTGAFERAGLIDVACEALDVPTRFRDFDDYWSPFLGGTGPAAAYVAGLEPARRDALAARLERELVRDDDGGITLVARAWAVRATVR